jgi:acetate kinase
MPEEFVLCSGHAERIGLDNSAIRHKYKDQQINKLLDIPNHKEALDLIVDLLINDENGVIPDIKELRAVGHRVVHGGHTFTNTTEVTDDVKERIRELFSLAPLHNPSNLEGISVSEDAFPDATQVAVFDTAFHQSIHQKAFTYAIPYDLLEKHNIRLYGFHGTSHKYVSQLAAQFLAKETSKIITLHLGNGSSATAVVNGKSVDHSLGFSPVNGLVMGTRSGDIDHSLIFYLVNTLKYDVETVNGILQNESGLLGLTGYSDLREIVTKAKQGDERCQLALDIKVYRIKKYIGAYVAAMNGLDCLVFTAGIGENSDVIRKMVCKDMDVLGIELDEEKNAKTVAGLREISTENSKVKVLVIPTNEELEIARQTYQLCIGHHKKTE